MGRSVSPTFNSFFDPQTDTVLRDRNVQPPKMMHAGPPLMLLAAVHESGFGTKLECRDVRYHDPTLGDKQAHW
jgi:hypothetical protein